MIRAARALSRRARALQSATTNAAPYYHVDLDHEQGGERAPLQHAPQHALHPSRLWNTTNKRLFA